MTEPPAPRRVKDARPGKRTAAMSIVRLALESGKTVILAEPGHVCTVTPLRKRPDA